MPQWLLIAWMLLNLALVAASLFVPRLMKITESPTEPSLSPLSPGAPLGIPSQIQGPESTENLGIQNFPRKGAQESRKG